MIRKKENDVFLIATAITNFNESTNNENLWDEFKKSSNSEQI